MTSPAQAGVERFFADVAVNRTEECVRASAHDAAIAALTAELQQCREALPSDAVLAEIRGRVDAAPDEPPFSHGAWAIRDRRVLLEAIDRLRAAR